MQATAALFEQFLVGRSGRLLHCRWDAAASLRNFLVGRTGSAHRMLVCTRAAKNQGRVAVDKARRHPSAVQCIDRFGPEARKLRALADADDLPIRNGDCAILDKPARIARAILESDNITV